ncbi:hypothetical protein C5167_013892 [Papaver somniferum]|uniref:Bms1-type G domain-containing protein n=1 Tax=Papaver somniferum TaxID=3469 RepID=A0A4Y7J4P8_PAPSO|nr:hypothetical protein C5167_013892 [Papaver somniferum]
MGGSRDQVNKAHKTRFSSKATRQIHKTSNAGNRISKPNKKNAAKGARDARIQRNKMLRTQKRDALLKEKRASSGQNSPPRIIVLFGLSSSVNTKVLAKELLELLSPEDAGAASATVASPSYHLRATVLVAPHGDLMSCIEMAKVADLFAFVTDASPCSSNSHIDQFGAQCLSFFRSLGLPSSVVLIRNLPCDPHKRNDMRKRCASSLASEFTDDSKFYPADTKEELHKQFIHFIVSHLFRSQFMSVFKEQRPSVPHWRGQRAYLMAEEVDLVVDDKNPGTCTLSLTGYLRARSLSVNQLVHVSGVGDFQLCKIVVLKDPCPLIAKKGHNMMDSDELPSVQVLRSLVPDPLKQEPLLVENVPDPLGGEQEDMDLAKEFNRQKKQKRAVPRGTSEYQAAWFEGDEDSDLENDNDDMLMDEGDNDFPGLQDGNHSDLDDDKSSLELGDSDEETQADTMMTDGEQLTKEQIEAEIRKIKEAHAEDEEYPDEVDAPTDVLALKRFAKYRGLKSIRTCAWDPKESLPPDYARLFEFENFARTQKAVLAKAQDTEQSSNDESVPTGTYVRLHVKEVLSDVATKLREASKRFPVIACGLLQHESKMSVLHFSVKKHETYDAPIKSKESLIFHVGFRQFVARPIFSSDAIRSGNHKSERFLHPGRFSMASVYAPVSFPPLPLIVFKQGDVEPTVAAVDHPLQQMAHAEIKPRMTRIDGPPSETYPANQTHFAMSSRGTHSQICYPLRVQKSKATVRYMFHHPRDITWFKKVELWTKCGRRGRVKEAVGSMKCLFNGVVQQHDTVCMNLYKRVYPKWPENLYRILDA